MLIREIKRVVLILGPLLGLLLLISLSYWGTPRYSSLRSKVGDLVTQWNPGYYSNSSTFPGSSSINETHTEIRSLSTPDGRYFHIRFGNHTAFNPNIIPHPALNNTFIIVAQKRRVNPDGSEPSDTSVFHVEIGCTAHFVTSPPPTVPGSPPSSQYEGREGEELVHSLECMEHPEALPISATPGNKCTGELAYMSWNIGPHDARVFWGPKKPYIIFGSNSARTCFGMFLQDFRVLMDWKPVTFGQESFRMATELQRPGRWGIIEKNWFVWWDWQGAMYAHYEMVPGRVFARLDGNGAAGRDLGPLVGGTQQQQNGYGEEDDNDDEKENGIKFDGRERKKAGGRKKDTTDNNRDVKCMERYFPRLPRGRPEDIHQATNSLRVTLCNRRHGGNKTRTESSEEGGERGYNSKGKFVADEKEEERGGENCVPDNSNTVIMTIVHHKTYYDYHGEYEPYVVLFRQRKPFELYGISRKPLWIRGRQRQSAKRSDMFYVASVSWKEKGKGYHGFLDDVVFLGFGIEDRASGGMDLTMGDLLQGIGLC